MSKFGRACLLFVAILFWIAVLVPVFFVAGDCLGSAIRGAYHGLGDGEIMYGLEAAADTLFFYLTFLFPLAFLWFGFLISAIVLTVATVITRKPAAEKCA